MTPRQHRLGRLLALRLVRLREAGRRLGMAADSARSIAAVAARIAELRAEPSVVAGHGDGYRVKAAAATRAALGAAGARQAARLAVVLVERGAAATAVQQRQASADAVARAVSREQAATPVVKTEQPLPRRRATP